MAETSLSLAARGPLAVEPGVAALYREHAGMVRQALRQLGVPPSCLDDATQDVFVVLHRRIDDFERERSLKNWLWGIARGVASGYRRADRRRQRLHAALPRPEGTCGTERGVARGEAEAILGDFLGSLDADKCAVFVLSEIEGRRGPEIAALLEVNLNTVYARLRAARRRFDDAMARHRTPASRPMFAAWLPWAWPTWLGKPALAVGVGAMTLLAASPGEPPGAAGPEPTAESLAQASPAPEPEVTPALASRSGSASADVPEPRRGELRVQVIGPAASEAEVCLELEVGAEVLCAGLEGEPGGTASALPEGRYQVWSRAPGWLEAHATVEVVAGEHEEIELVMSQPPTSAERATRSPARPRPVLVADARAIAEPVEVEAVTVVAPPLRQPWMSSIEGRRPVRHASLVQLRQDFIAELLLVAARL